MRKVIIGGVIVVGLALLSGLLASPGTLGLRIDPGSVQTGAPPTGEVREGGPSTNASPQAEPRDATKTAGTPISVAGAQLSTQVEAFILVNPTSAAPGASVEVSGSRFDPGATVDLSIRRTESDKPQDIGFAQIDQAGSFGGISFVVPSDFSGSFTVIARQQGSGKEARAEVQVMSGSPQVTLGTGVGTPGTPITFSAEGFLPGETVKVFFNAMSGEPVVTFQADPGGAIRRQSIRVPYGAIGNNNFIFVGDKSQTLVTVPFLMLNLYPTVALNSYAAKADTVLTFDGEGFGPQERVRVHLNNPSAPPVGFIETDETGAFAMAGGLRIPFELTGKNTLIFVGERSQAAVTTSFDVLPYTPYAEASTYGGRPGTTITFYGSGFARDEVVYIYAGVSEQSEGSLSACAKADELGNIRAGGSYTIPGNVERGKLNFRLEGQKSKSAALATVEILDSGGPVDVPADNPQDFKCPYDQPPAPEQQPAGGQAQPGAAGQPAGSPTAAPTGQATPGTGGQTPTPTSRSERDGASPTPDRSDEEERETPTPGRSPTRGATALPSPTARPTERPAPTARPTDTPKPSPTRSDQQSERR